MNYIDTTCFFYIRERAKNEYVSIGSNGNILRWGYTGGFDQQWLIIPIGSDGLCKFMTRQNGEFMSVGSNGNILRWGDGGSNQFRIVNEQQDGWFNIQEPTKNEYVAVGSNGNILRWGRSGGADQQFKLEPVNIMPRLSLKQDERWYYPSQIPNPPELKGFDEDPPLESQRYYISGQVLPAVLVDDPRYSDKLRQVEGSPYYTLKRYQQWSRSQRQGYGILETFTGASQEKKEIKTKKGMTTTHRQEIEHVVSWNVAAELKGSVSGGEKAGEKGGKEATGSGELTLQAGYSDTTTTRQWTETTITNEEEVTTTKMYEPRDCSFRVAVWSLLDVYTLTDNQGKPVKEWSVMQEHATRNTMYPPLKSSEDIKRIPNSSTYYNIIAKHSGKYLDVTGASTEDGANIIQWEKTGGDNQKWKLENAGDGYYYIVAKHSNKVLDITGASTENGVNISQYPLWNNNNQKWKLEDAGDSYYYIVAKHSNKVMDVTEGSTENGAHIIQWEKQGTDNQKWKLEAV